MVGVQRKIAQQGALEGASEREATVIAPHIDRVR